MSNRPQTRGEEIANHAVPARSNPKQVLRVADHGAIYPLMGWLVVIAIHPLAVAVGPAGLAWLLAGGASYTVGVLFYARPRMRYAHLVWHLFVLGGSACHLVAVAAYANGIPRWARFPRLPTTAVHAS